MKSSTVCFVLFSVYAAPHLNSMLSLLVGFLWIGAGLHDLWRGK